MTKMVTFGISWSLLSVASKSLFYKHFSKNLPVNAQKSDPQGHFRAILMYIRILEVPICKPFAKKTLIKSVSCNIFNIFFRNLNFLASTMHYIRQAQGKFPGRHDQPVADRWSQACARHGSRLKNPTLEYVIMSIKDDLTKASNAPKSAPKPKAKRTRKQAATATASNTDMVILKSTVKFNGMTMTSGKYQGHTWAVCGTRKLAYKGLRHAGFSALTISALIILGLATHSAKSGLKSTGKGTDRMNALKELCSSSMVNHWKASGYLEVCPDGYKLSADGLNNLLSRLSKASDSYATNDSAVQAALAARLERTAIEIDGNVLDFSHPVRVAMVK